MLSAREQELLTAYVDGELSARERRLVARLLQRNAQARTLLAQLQSDSRELQAMPVLTAPVDFADRVLARISRSPLPVIRQPRLVPCPPVRFSLWRGLAAAAAVLLAVGVGSFFLNQPTRPNGEIENPIAHNGTEGHHDVEAHDPRTEVAHEKASPTRDKGSSVVSKDLRTPLDPPRSEADESRRPDDLGKADPDRSAERIMTSPGRENLGPFERVELALPTIHKLHALDSAEEGNQLGLRLASAGAIRVEITARDASRGFARVQRALADRKVSLVVDPSTAARIKKPHWRTDIALFAENIAPADLVEILRGIGIADRQAGDKKPSEMRFDGSLVVNEISALDRRELHDLLGIDPVKVRPSPLPSRPVDIRRPLAEQTANQVAAALRGQGSVRPGTTSHPRSAYVTALNGPRGRSMDLTSFLGSRQPALLGTLQVFLVLRNVAP